MILDVLANYLPLAIGLLVFAVLLMILAAAFKKRPAAAAPYERRGPLLTAAEQQFYMRLVQAAPEGSRLFSKVRMADVLKVKKTANKSDWQPAFNKISGKHFDFVLCHSNSFEIQAVIELDDKSHNSSKAKIKDRFIDTACASAAIPIIRIKASNTYNVSTIRDRIHSALENTETT